MALKTDLLGLPAIVANLDTGKDTTTMRLHVRTTASAIVIALATIAVIFLNPISARAHCDALDGPVVMAAKKALSQGDATPVLKWVNENQEAEIQDALKKTREASRGDGMAKNLAETYFFETVVRLHRAGEGAPYTGLKPAGTDPGPAVKLGDKALESGSVDDLVKFVTHEVQEGIRKRFAHAAEKRRHAEDSIAAGREFVKAYVEFLHYVDRVYSDAKGTASHNAEKSETHVSQNEHKRK